MCGERQHAVASIRKKKIGWYSSLNGIVFPFSGINGLQKTRISRVPATYEAQIEVITHPLRGPKVRTKPKVAA